MKIYVCPHCGFIVKEKSKNCPMCYGKMVNKKGLFTSKVVKTFENKDRDVNIYYTCIKCRDKITQEICIKCNCKGLLSISYNGKSEIIKRLNSLYDIYNKDEVANILSQLSQDEKYTLYRQFASTNLYKRDGLKAGVCFFVGFLIYILCLNIATNYVNQYIVIGYISNAFGNAIFTIFLLLGFLYLKNASFTENEKVAGDIGIISGSIHFIYFLVCILGNLEFKEALIIGYICIFISFIFYSFYYLIKRYKRKRHA